MANSVVILIPARMASTRLPGKPLADIAGRPMIVHVLDRAREAGLGPVYVATDSEKISTAVAKAGGQAVMTRSDHVSGSDRIFEAMEQIGAGADVIVNVQGDLPTIAPADIRAALLPLNDRAVDIATLAAEIRRAEERTDPNVVKVVGTPVGNPPSLSSPAPLPHPPSLAAAGTEGDSGGKAGGRLRALYFTRAAAPHGDGPLYHHIGLYAYRRAALERFVRLPASTLERREKLEQLRALEAGMRIDVTIVASVPLGVDTPTDLEAARRILAQ
ncbi:MAG TPA: manno-octulosonate cytidylyltransferase [Xanthobacteraceae bacterium]|jgi:3-deoxy-manno-octulosonate cytidylyltransferase (CMP-KDO synthetase)|nr:manno-octulosonate cytidylyltransferase [Xanthobacteraceae bacterium]